MKHTLAAAALALTALGSTVQAAPVQWTTASGGNGNWYEIVLHTAGNISWQQANSSARNSYYQGARGYLASITSAAEQAFLNTLNAAFTASNNLGGQYTKSWLGAKDSKAEGDWMWISKEPFAYSNWSPGEPNNFGNEDFMVGWWSGDGWNDCKRRCDIASFVVEYKGSDVAPVPLPASLPLAAAGLGLLGWIGRRRKPA